ncbi:SDR family NAD(P)-dependent oxidoreductase [Micromonospora halophytica]|uniref:Nucleoside-diphosphate-sugar epimerase n=1 Tax=Micromonospora halophytica TaxID=47864 RepID=A0A1C5IKU9_9ACTN|nr:SDR family NAD(P)-dependent oxidoreductase [Micromonospora halophytica]SCG58988.1 Nucleoside-diphosphate-sugar epimerase [Micromonospora halophytica]
MLVLVTGGTGFVGAHTVAALAAAGHRVRVLARDADRVAPALSPLSVPSEAVEVATGDVTDEPAVNRAVRGVDAVVHAASVYSFDSRWHAATRGTNVRGTEVVLDAARRFGVGRTVHVSTFGAMLPSPTGVVGPQSPPGTARETYLASKAKAERVARWHQDQGEPVVISYPPALLGPDDPKLGDQNSRLRNMLRGLMPVWPGGGFPVGDVRDTAALHAALLTVPLADGNRHFGPGRYLSTRDYVRAVREVTGRRLPTLFLPARAMLPFAQLTDVVQRVWPWHIPAEYGACYVCACDARPEAGAPSAGLTPRPFAETLADTVRWLHRSGRLTAAQAGRAAATSIDHGAPAAPSVRAAASRREEARP